MKSQMNWQNSENLHHLHLHALYHSLKSIILSTSYKTQPRPLEQQCTEAHQDGRNTTKIINNLNNSLISSRKDYRTSIHLITGHYGLNKHLNNMKNTDPKNASFVGIKRKPSLTFSANVQLLPSSESMTFSITFTYHQLLA